MSTADRERARQRGEAACLVAAALGELRLDQRADPVVPQAHRMERMHQRGFKRLLGLVEGVGLGGGQRMAEQRDVLAQRPAAGATARHGRVHQLGGAVPFAVEQHQDAALVLVDGGIDGVAEVDHHSGLGEVCARQLCIARRDGGEHHRQVCLGAHRRRALAGERERASRMIQRFVDTAEQRADGDDHAVPTQQRGRRGVRLGAGAVDLHDDAVEAHDLAGPQQVVRQRAQQDALARALRLVEHALCEVGDRCGQRVRRLAIDERSQQARQHAQIGLGVALREIGRRVLLQHRHPRLDGVQARTEEDDRIGRRCGGVERAERVAGFHEAAVRAFEVLQRSRGFGGELGVAEPVRCLRAGARGLGQRE